MKKYSFVAGVLLLCDVLPHVVRLSKLLQSKDLDVAFVQAKLTHCLSSIQAVRDNIADGVGESFSAVAAECQDIGIQVSADDQDNFLHRTGEILLGHCVSYGWYNRQQDNLFFSHPSNV